MKNIGSVTTVRKVVSKCGDDGKLQIRELKKLIRDGQRSGDAVLVGAAYYYTAMAYKALGKPDELLMNAHKAVMLLKNSSEHEILINAYIALSTYYGEHENYQTAFINVLEAHRLVKKHRIKGRVRLVVLNILSNCYHGMGDYRESARLLSESLKDAPDDGPVGRAKRLLNLSSCCKDAGNIEKAKEILDSMEDWIDCVPFAALVSDYYFRRALVAYDLGEWEEGDRFVDAGIPLIPDSGYPGPLYDDMRRVMHFLGVKGDRERAALFFERMKDYAENNPDPIDQFVAVRAMADHCACFGEYEKAAEYFKRLDELYDVRTKETRAVQLSIQKRVMDTEAELGRLARRMRESERLASLEPMTKLMNRSALLAVSSEFISAASKKGGKVGGIFIDIDFFKECNDSYGHAKGDDIIREVADACRMEENEDIRFARYGGDEFFGVTKGLSDEEIKAVAVRICERIRSADIPHVNNPNGGRITLSVGVVNVGITKRTDTVIEIANYADKALYHAKNSGRNAIFFLEHDGSSKNSPSYERIDF